MARRKREIGKTGIYHILLRGVNNLFFKAEDYDEFAEIIKTHTAQGNIKVISYLLLKNRIHLVIDTMGGGIGERIKPVTISYARYFNRTHGTKGKLFYDRFKSEPVDGKKELENVVSFVNAISEFEGAEYSSLKNPLCSLRDSGLTAEESQSTKIVSMYIEDYDCLSKNDLAKYISAFCGIVPKDYKLLSETEQKFILEKLTAKFWISKSKIYELLGIKN